ncbi:ABC transporter ATP-binding protein [Taurinivorans muris]|uniref:ABC transporter ATP-binding protein n=1 Tax=Taurinivorans muris TaxID=2787751 RepID=A0ABY5Y2M0_9BACT|nr:ABC transporter ATP-binding protein [Desulfovibrionaceae bacterium LT0009]
MLLSIIKKNNFVQNYLKMWPFVKPIWFISLLSLVIGVPIGSLDATIALFLKPYTDLVIVSNNAQAPWYLPFLIVGFTIIQGVLLYLSAFLTAYAGGKLNLNVKEALYNKLLSLDPKYYDEQNSGRILMRFSSDADLACSGLLSNLKNLVTRVCSTLSLLCVLIYTSWQLSIIAIIILAITVAPLTTVRRLLKKIIAKNTDVISTINTKYNETYSGNRTILAYNLQDTQRNSFIMNLNEIFKLSVKMVKRTAWISPFMHFSVSIGISLTIAYGSWLIVQGTITAGDFVSFLAALLMMYTPLKAMGNTIVNIQQGFLAIERIYDILDIEPDIQNSPEALKITNFDHAIKFQNVNFSYREGIPVLHDFSLEIKKNESIALVGNSGGGKSTIVSLLPRFYDIQSGAITIDGNNIKNIEIEALRSQITIVFQDNFLFNGTIRDNILLGKANATEEEIRQAIKAAYLDEFIAELENGLDTPIGERGNLLSGGQKQRVAIARAFLRNSPILILDEATSALDNKSEAIVQKAIENLMANKTVIIIAHRLSTIKNVDKIAFIQEGSLAEFGTHNELMNIKNGHYKTLYNLQFKSNTASAYDEE